MSIVSQDWRAFFVVGVSRSYCCAPAAVASGSVNLSQAGETEHTMNMLWLPPGEPDLGIFFGFGSVKLACAS